MISLAWMSSLSSLFSLTIRNTLLAASTSPTLSHAVIREPYVTIVGSNSSSFSCCSKLNAPAKFNPSAHARIAALYVTMFGLVVDVGDFIASNNFKALVMGILTSSIPILRSSSSRFLAKLALAEAHALITAENVTTFGWIPSCLMVWISFIA